MGRGGDFRDKPKEFGAVMGFTEVSNLGKNEPDTIGKYQAAKLSGAEAGKYAQNNGTIAAFGSDGRLRVWIPNEQGDARTVPYQKAIENLKEAGYTEGSFYVPFSN